MYPITKPQIKLKYNLLLDNELNDTSSAFRLAPIITSGYVGGEKK